MPWPPFSLLTFNALANDHGMAKQKFRPTRLGVFSRAKAYIGYVEVLKKRHNAVGRTFCDAISFRRDKKKVRRVQGAAPAVLFFALKPVSTTSLQPPASSLQPPAISYQLSADNQNL